MERWKGGGRRTPVVWNNRRRRGRNNKELGIVGKKCSGNKWNAGKVKSKDGIKKKKEIIDWTYINIKDVERNT